LLGGAEINGRGRREKKKDLKVRKGEVRFPPSSLGNQKEKKFEGRGKRWRIRISSVFPSFEYAKNGERDHHGEKGGSLLDQKKLAYETP